MEFGANASSECIGCLLKNEVVTQTLEDEGSLARRPQRDEEYSSVDHARVEALVRPDCLYQEG